MGTSLMDEAESGIVKQPLFYIVYGVDGVGKSQLASGGKNLLYIGPENRTNHLSVTRKAGQKSYEDNVKVVERLLTEKHDYEGVVFESLDWFMKVCWKKACEESGVKAIAKALGGYGKGFVRGDELGLEFLNLLLRLRDEREMTLGVSAHADQVKVSDPVTATDYSRFVIKGREEFVGPWREAADLVGYLHYERVKTEDDERAFGDGTRLLACNWTPAWDAKNSFGIKEPFEIPETSKGGSEGFDVLMKEVGAASPDRVNEVVVEIERIKHEIGDSDRIEKINTRIKKITETDDIALAEKLLKQVKKAIEKKD